MKRWGPWISLIFVVMVIVAMLSNGVMRASSGLALRQLSGQSEKSSYESLSHLSSAALSNDLGAAVLLAESNPADNQSDGPGERMEPLRAYTKSHPKDASALAVLCRLSTIGIRGQWKPDPKAKPIVHSEKWKANAERALAEARIGTQLEPTNWYFRICEAHFLLALGRKEEISKALNAAPLPTKYDDHLSGEIKAINDYLNSGFWGGTAIERMSRMAGLLFPHFSGMRELAKGELAYSNRDPKVRARWMRIGVRLFDDSESLIGLLVGKAITSIGANEKESMDQSIPFEQRGPKLLAMFDQFKSKYPNELTKEEADRVNHILTKKFDSDLTSDTGYDLGVHLASPTLAVLCGSLLALIGAALTLIPLKVPAKRWWISPTAVGLASASFAILPTKTTAIQNLSGWLVSVEGPIDSGFYAIRLGCIIVIGLMVAFAGFFNRENSHRAQTVPTILILTILAALIPPIVMPCLFLSFALAAVTDSGEFIRPVTVLALITSAIAFQFLGLGLSGTIVWTLSALIWAIFTEKKDSFSPTVLIATGGLMVAGLSAIRVDQLLNGGHWTDDKAIQTMRS